MRTGATILAATAALGLLTMSAGRSGAQSAPNSPNGMPDIVGLYPGMYIGDAYNLLKAYYPERGGKVDMQQQQIHGLNGDKPVVIQLHIPAQDQQGPYDDVIDVLVTLPPNRQAVWAVNRQLRFPTGKEPSLEATVAGLRQKYGPELPGAFHGVVANTLRWIVDPQGKRVSGAMTECMQSTYKLESLRTFVVNPSPRIFEHLLNAPAGLAGGEACKTFTYLQAEITTNYGGPVAGLTLTMWDVDLGRESGLRTQAAINGVANTEEKQADQRQKQIDKSAVPKF